MSVIARFTSGRPAGAVTAGLVAVAALAAACGGGAAGAPPDGVGEGGETVTLRLGYFPNVTHASAIVGVDKGFIADRLPDGVELEPATFNDGSEAIEALFSGAIDATFIGPNPAVTGFAQSEGAALRIVSGATSGGASLVVQPGIEGPQDLAGTTLSSPSLGNTQDVALRAWLGDQGLETDLQGGGDVSILPQENAQIFETFRSQDIDGAWVPEPWATRMISEAGGVELVDEADLWPGGRFVTTHLIVATEFLEQHPDAVKGLLAGHVEATEFTVGNPEESKQIVREAIETITGAAIAPATVAGAWKKLEFTVDPIASSLKRSADDAIAVGLLDPVDLEGIYDLTLLNEILAGLGLDQVSA